MRDQNSKRAQLANAVILLMSTFAVCTLAGYFSLVNRDLRVPEAIVMDEARFTGIRALLPARGTIGYLSDTGGIERNPKAYYLTQYYLAPLVVAADPDHDLVIANFASPSAIATLAAANGLTVKHDFPNGVALLGRRAR